MSSTPFFRVNSLSKHFDGVRAVDSLSFDIQPGKITAVIGPNGAGKTTLFNIITGFLPPDTGSVEFQSLRLSSMPPHRIARAGIGRTFQNIRLFPQMTVLENVLIATRYPTGERLTSALLRSRSMVSEDTENRNRAIQHLETVGMAHKRDAMGDELSHGQRRLVELARALALDPKLLLLDEPTSGLSPERRQELQKIVRRLVESGKTILFIEHNLDVVMGLSDRIIVLNHGKGIAEGTPSEVQNNPAVIEAYLGRGRSNAPSG